MLQLQKTKLQHNRSLQFSSIQPNKNLHVIMYWEEVGALTVKKIIEAIQLLYSSQHTSCTLTTLSIFTPQLNLNT